MMMNDEHDGDVKVITTEELLSSIYNMVAELNLEVKSLKEEVTSIKKKVQDKIEADNIIFKDFHSKLTLLCPNTVEVNSFKFKKIKHNFPLTKYSTILLCSLRFQIDQNT